MNNNNFFLLSVSENYTPLATTVEGVLAALDDSFIRAASMTMPSFSESEQSVKAVDFAGFIFVTIL